MAHSIPVSVRVSDQEKLLLEAAADRAHTNLSDFIRRTALEAAEIDLLDRRIVTIGSDDWARFEAWAYAPPADNDALKQLAKSRPAWQD